MLYVLITYILFLALFDQYGGDSVAWQVIYFAVQYGFAGAVALTQIKGRMKTAYISIALIFAVLTVNELSFINSTLENYSQAFSATPVYIFSVFIILVFITYELIRWKKQLNYPK